MLKVIKALHHLIPENVLKFIYIFHFLYCIYVVDVANVYIKFHFCVCIYIYILTLFHIQFSI